MSANADEPKKTPTGQEEVNQTLCPYLQDGECPQPEGAGAKEPDKKYLYSLLESAIAADPDEPMYKEFYDKKCNLDQQSRWQSKTAFCYGI